MLLFREGCHFVLPNSTGYFEWLFGNYCCKWTCFLVLLSCVANTCTCIYICMQFWYFEGDHCEQGVFLKGICKSSSSYGSCFFFCFVTNDVNELHLTAFMYWLWLVYVSVLVFAWQPLYCSMFYLLFGEGIPFSTLQWFWHRHAFIVLLACASSSCLATSCDKFALCVCKWYHVSAIGCFLCKRMRAFVITTKIPLCGFL